MDLTQQALQTNANLVLIFGIIFQINYIFLKIIVALGLCMRDGGNVIIIEAIVK